MRRVDAVDSALPAVEKPATRAASGPQTSTSSVRPHPSRVAPRRRRRVGRLALECVGLAFGVHLLLPQIGGLASTGEQMVTATWWLLVSLVVLEAASLAAYSELILTGLRRLGAPAPRALVHRIVVVGTSLGRSLPAGNAAAFAVAVRELRRVGIDPILAGTAVAASGLLSSMVLAGLLPLGVALAVGTGQLGGPGLSVSATAVVILLAAGITPWMSRRPDVVADTARRLTSKVARGPLRHWLHPDRIHEMVRRGVLGVRQLAVDRRTLLISCGWAASNWLLDAAVVVLLAVTIGRGTPLTPILLAYIIAQLATALPLTPGGVGIVEGAMIGALMAAGAAVGSATVVVLGWRLISHWIPIVTGLALLPTLTGDLGERRVSGLLRAVR